MGIMEQLAEAKIQDWLRRGRPKGRADEDLPGAGSLEGQLLRELVALQLHVRAEADRVAHDELVKRARALRLQLLVLLERSGRPLAARRVEEMLADLDTAE